jgi:methylenetetrahydrofolate dehydrogenase (NAD+)
VGLRKRRHEVVEKPGWTLKDCLPLSDVVISGVPGDKYKVPLDLMRPGAACINFSSERNFTPEVKEKASIYVPAIGKVTIAVLLRNLLVCIYTHPRFVNVELGLTDNATSVSLRTGSMLLLMA